MSENSNENRLDTINISDDLESQVENLMNNEDLLVCDHHECL